jgi:hypothetical protein
VQRSSGAAIDNAGQVDKENGGKDRDVSGQTAFSGHPF